MFSCNIPYLRSKIRLILLCCMEIIKLYIYVLQHLEVLLFFWLSGHHGVPQQVLLVHMTAIYDSSSGEKKKKRKSKISLSKAGEESNDQIASRKPTKQVLVTITKIHWVLIASITHNYLNICCFSLFFLFWEALFVTNGILSWNWVPCPEVNSIYQSQLEAKCQNTPKPTVCVCVIMMHTVTILSWF